MTREERAAQLADELEAVRAGNLSAESFRDKHSDDRASSPLSALWAHLNHYLADTDIRERDARYRAVQNAELEKLLVLLRRGAADSELARVHFLGPS